MRMSPATPCVTRAGTRVVGLGPTTHARADATVNRPRPIVYTRRRPTSSPGWPAVMRNAANERP